MIDHVYLPVGELERSRSFYRSLLTAIGIEEGFAFADSVVFGFGGGGALWIYPTSGRAGPSDDPCGPDAMIGAEPPRMHLAFRVETRAHVHAFHSAAIELQANVLREPRLFPVYHPDYFATFVADPDGHTIEAVCHAGPASQPDAPMLSWPPPAIACLGRPAHV